MMVISCTNYFYCFLFKLLFSRGVILMRLELSGKIQSASLISVTEPETDLFLPSTPSDKLATESGVSEMLQ